jgi:hypothetical protein
MLCALLFQAADFDLDEPELLSAVSGMTILDDNDDFFAHATEMALHGPPVEPSKPTSKGNRAWVVFNGRKLGIFETW